VILCDFPDRQDARPRMLECFAIANRRLLLLPGHPSHQAWSIFMPVLYTAISKNADENYTIVKFY
jgi:hypothetical protein